MRHPGCIATAEHRGRGLLRLLGVSLLAVAGIAWLAPVAALGVGSLRTQSALNQPFYGEIDLFDLGQTELDGIKVSLASRSAYEQAGIDRPHFLTRLQFTPMVGPGGVPVIQVISREPIREPYLDLLVEVIWPDGRLVKEHAVLLDPPAVGSERVALVNKGRARPPPRAPRPAESSPFARAAEASRVQGPGSHSSSRAPATAVSDASIDESDVAAAESLVVEEVTSVQIPAASAEVEFPLRSGPVPPGAGLGRIARRMAPPAATLEQTAMALFRNNQQAFVGGDINRLRLGSELSIPSAAELFVLGPEAAREAYRDALAGRPSARAPLTDVDVRLTIATSTGSSDAVSDSERPPVQEAMAADAEPIAGDVDMAPPQAEVVEAEILLMREASEANRQETTELRERIRSLEAQLGDIRKLLELRNQQLAQLALAGVPSLAAGGAAPREQGLESPREAEPVADDDEVVEAFVEQEQVRVEEVEPEPATAAAESAAGAEPMAGERDAETAPVASTSDDAGLESDDAAAADRADDVTMTQAESAGDDGPQGTSDGGLFSSLAALREAMPSWSLPLVAVALLLALLGLRIQRRREQADEAETSVSSGADSEHPGREKAVDLALDSDWPLAKGNAAAVLDPGPDQRAVAEAEAAAVKESPQALDGLGEADLYLAYGRYRDAERTLQEAAASSPSPRLRFKLAEVYERSGDREALAMLAGKMRVAGDPLLDEARWTAIERALAEGNEASLDLPADEAPEIRFDGVDAGAMAGMQFGSEASRKRHPEADSETALETQTALEPVSASEPALEPPSELELEVVPQTAAEPNPEADDLYLDLDDLDDLIETREPSAPDASAGKETGVARSPEEPPPAASDEFIELDLADLDAIAEMPSLPDQTLAAGVGEKAGDLELPTVDDLPDLSAAALDPVADVGAAVGDTSAEAITVDAAKPGAFGADARGSESVAVAADAGGWSLEVDELDEVALKLDLARAYLDMDDAEAAAAILCEVVAEGRDDQQAAARALLAKIE